MKLFKRKKREVYENPWDKYYPEGKRSVNIPDMSIYEYLEKNIYNNPEEIAINYFGVTIKFSELLDKIDLCAKALRSCGVRENDVVTICMPNTPEAVISFYAVNKIGAIANMIHPLSSELEIRDSLIATKSVLLIAINLSYSKVVKIIDETSVYKTIICSAKDSMPKLLSLGYLVTQEWKMDLPKSNENFLLWSDFIIRGEKYDKRVDKIRGKDDDAIYLHSGGTTGIPKNIVLTNGNVNALLEQASIIFPKIGVGDRFLSILPMFHCFGLIVCICVPLTLGATAYLIPQFDAKRFDKLIRKNKPTVLAGVPTLFEALVTNPYMMNVDMSFVQYVVSGGDSLTPEKNRVVNEFLKEHNCEVGVMQGYGMTESTGPASFGSFGSGKDGSIGIPLPGNKIQILNVETKEEVKPGEIGEICITGPTIMSRYLDNPEATNNMIYIHDDGLRWVHTGDLGYMDEDGVVFFVQRLKRMLIVSGYNVYPSHIENVLMKNELVANCGVIGVPHPYKVQVPKAFIVLKDGVENNSDTINSIKEYCKKNLANYMIPKEFVVRDSLPKTMVGKVNYRELEKEEENKNK